MKKFNVDKCVSERVTTPEFEKPRRVHDWRNYVPGICKDNWLNLSEETRLVIIAICDDFAGREEWD